MTDNETKLIARLKETAAAFSRIAGLLNGTVAATSLLSGTQYPERANLLMAVSEAFDVAHGWHNLCAEEVTIAQGRTKVNRFTERETATILAALRWFQASSPISMPVAFLTEAAKVAEGDDAGRAQWPLDIFFTEGMPTIGEIDTLCEAIFEDAAKAIDTGKVMQDAVLLLRDAGIMAAYEHPGYIAIPVEPGTAVHFGTANGDYGADYASATGDDRSPSRIVWSLPRDVTAEQLATSIKTWFKGAL